MAHFGDGKDTGALRTIGEVSDALGIKPHVLRYWEEQFPTLTPLKRAGGRRLYRPEDIALIQRIDSLVSREGYTLKGARAALREPAATRAAKQARLVEETAARAPAPPHDLVPRLKAIRTQLATALAS